jgi:antitoxin CptB
MRRGLKELDVVLERYRRRRYARAPAAERVALARLLEQEDPVLLRWLMGQDAPPAEFEELVHELRRHD